METIIIPCTCQHEWQDKKYGKGMRVHNETKKHGIYRCTVCKKENAAVAIKAA
jgi:hypothetical protein